MAKQAKPSKKVPEKIAKKIPAKAPVKVPVQILGQNESIAVAVEVAVPNAASSVVKSSVKNILSIGTNMDHRFIPDYKELDKIVRTFKQMGYRVVLTQGVYDLIHEGHAAYLETAKAQGDVLIVGVDSDELTRKRKGPDRPIVPQTERLKMLVHLRHVDIVTLRHVNHDLGTLIRLVRPDVLVVSKSTTDFTYDMAAEYEQFCGSIVSLPPQSTTSTSARIRNLTIESVEKLAQQVTELTASFLSNIRKK